MDATRRPTPAQAPQARPQAVEGRLTRAGRELFVPRRVADLATHQDGLVSTAQLRALGVDDDTILRWVRAGWLHRRHESVFSVGHRVVSPRGRRRAALLAAGDMAALSHRAAGVQLDLGRWSLQTIDVIVHRGGERRRDGICFHRPSHLSWSLDVTEIDGLRCTTPARTLLDLAAVLRPDQLERA